MQERLSGSGNAAGFIAVIFGMIIAEHGLNFLKGLPGNIGWIFVVDPKFPLFYWEAFHALSATYSAPRRVSASPIDKGASVSRIFEKEDDRADGWLSPDQIPKAVQARQQELLPV